VQRPLFHYRRNALFPLLFTALFLVLSILSGCSPRAEVLEAVDYTPLPGNGWQVSTPEEQGLDPMRVAERFCNAAVVQTLFALLVVKNGYLIAEGYLNGGSID